MATRAVDALLAARRTTSVRLAKMEKVARKRFIDLHLRGLWPQACGPNSLSATAVVEMEQGSSGGSLLHRLPPCVAKVS